jgi:hypothetical protein
MQNMKQGMLPLNVLPPQREVCCLQKTRIPAKTVDRGKKSASRIALDVAIEVEPSIMMLLFETVDTSHLATVALIGTHILYMLLILFGPTGSKESHPSGNWASRDGQKRGA